MFSGLKEKAETELKFKKAEHELKAKRRKIHLKYQNATWKSLNNPKTKGS